MDVSRYLAPGESVVLQLRRHPAVLLGPGAAAATAIAAALVIGYISGPDTTADVVDVAAGGIAAGVAARFGWKVLGWWAARIVVTGERILVVSGVLARDTAFVPLARVPEMVYRRSVLGRILGYGELGPAGAGAGGESGRLHHLPDPDRFYRVVSTAAMGGGVAPPVQVPEPPGWDRDDTGPLPRVVV